MEKASAINLVLLGGGLTLVGATLSLAEHNQRVACERSHPGDQAVCRQPGSGSMGHGGGGGGFGYASSTEGGISRGGFGGFGGGHGGSDGGGGE